MKKIALSLAVIAASSAYVWNQWGTDTGGDLLGMAPAKADSETLTAAPPAPASATPAHAGPADPIPVLSPPLERDAAAPQIAAPAVALVESRTPQGPAPVAPVPSPAPVALAAPMAAPVPADPPAVEAAAAPVEPVVVPDAPRPRPKPRLSARTTPLVTRVSMTVASAGGYADGAYTGSAVDAYYGMVQIQAIVQNGRLSGIKVLQYPSDRRTSVAINRQALPMLRDEAVAAQSANVDIVSGATLTSRAFARSLQSALRQAGA